MKKFFILLTINFSLLTVYAQVTQEWITTYNGPGNGTDWAHSIAADDSGNIYVTGESILSGTNYDYATIKYNSSGDSLWVRRYNGPGNGNDRATSMVVDASGKVYVTGSSIVSFDNTDYATVKYNSSGTQQWVQRYNGPGNSNDVGYSLTVDTSGNVYVTGYSIGSDMTYDWATIKYNSSGVQQWVVRYAGPGGDDDRAISIAIDISGNVYATGYRTTEIGNYYTDITTIKYNSSGTEQWIKAYNGPGNRSDGATSIAVDAAGNVFAAGSCSGIGINYSDYIIIKYNSSGDQLWTAIYNGPENTSDGVRSIAIDAFGNIYVTGSSGGLSTYSDYATIKYDPSGIEQWVRRYNGPVNFIDIAYAIALDNSGNAYVTGYSTGIQADYATIKYTSSGVQAWVQRYNGAGSPSDEAFAIAVDFSGNVYVTGFSGYTPNWDYVTIKYSQTVGITPVSSEISREFSLQQNYPNPFNPTTNIKFSIPEESYVSLKIYDMTGQVVQTYADGNMKAGTYNAEVDGSNLSSGIYFYTLIAGANIETKKMVLIK